MRVPARCRQMDEAVVQTLAGTRQVNEVICAVALLTQLPLAGAEKSLLGADKDSCLILAKALAGRGRRRS